MGMDPSADLALFAHFARRPEPEIDLLRAALLIAEPEYPGLDIAHYVDEIDRLGALARQRLDTALEEPPLGQILRLLHREVGFHGNSDDYYDPRNSFLNEVIDRRTGIPITLAVVAIEVAARARVDAHGVSFPGHFLLRAPAPIFFDPFGGRCLNEKALRELLARAGATGDPARLLQPATKTQILSRMLNNLRGIYSTRGDQARLRAVESRMLLLDGGPAATWTRSNPNN
jgi:regulator of sirC expression with transglutaminase-like and TPR domain